MSKFWKELFRNLGTKLKFSSAYHPQTDGQTEVINRCLQQYLRCFVHDHPSHWHRYLSLAEFWYNTAFHSSIKMSPFEALYHRPPPPLLPYYPRTSSQPAVDSLLTDHARILRTLKTNLLSAQHRMKRHQDHHRSDRDYAIGDYVFVRLQQYRQSSIALRHHKLMRKFFGPFRIIEKIGAVAYKLLLPPSSRIHNTFHISLLRPFTGDPSSIDPASIPPLPFLPALEPTPPDDLAITAAPSPSAVPVSTSPTAQPSLPSPPLHTETATDAPGPIRQESNDFMGGEVDMGLQPNRPGTDTSDTSNSQRTKRARQSPKYLKDYCQN